MFDASFICVKSSGMRGKNDVRSLGFAWNIKKPASTEPMDQFALNLDWSIHLN